MDFHLEDAAWNTKIRVFDEMKVPRMARCYLLFAVMLLLLLSACGDDESQDWPDGDWESPVSPSDSDTVDEPMPPQGDTDIIPSDADPIVDGDSETDQLEDGDGISDGDSDLEMDADPLEDKDGISDGDQDEDVELVPDGDVYEQADGDSAFPTSCHFNYDFQYDEVTRSFRSPISAENAFKKTDPGIDRIAHAEPPPKGTYAVPLAGKSSRSLVFPDYTDDMPPFERGQQWSGERCYEYSDRAWYLSESAAYELYAGIIKETLWYEIDRSVDVRSVVGLRGAYPGTFKWHENLPNRFNDTIVLLWIDAAGRKHVREFPVNTDTGAYNFGTDSSSSLRANRLYDYANGWHRGYNALQIQMWSYPVCDDTNHNGHWDSDRNGWLPPYYGEDHERDGSAHNIHLASVYAPLETAEVNNWSAGCQTIPGSENWLEFITNAWTEEGAPVDYFLIDVRDIASSVWTDCSEDDGSYDCPYKIREFPYQHNGDTSSAIEDRFDVYNCSDADESGPEVVYVMNIRERGTLSASVSVSDEDRFDPDIYILDGADSNACRERSHISLDHAITPGRYLLVVDTWVDENGQEKAGPYQLNVSFQ